MKEQLTEYITKHGLAETLRLMSAICDEKYEEQATRNPKLANKWDKAFTYLYQLAQKKSIETL